MNNEYDSCFNELKKEQDKNLDLRKNFNGREQYLLKQIDDLETQIQELKGKK